MTNDKRFEKCVWNSLNPSNPTKLKPNNENDFRTPKNYEQKEFKFLDIAFQIIFLHLTSCSNFYGVLEEKIKKLQFI